jgi:hypothetical protein
MRFARLAAPFASLIAVAGCSDPVPPTPQGAFSVTFLDSGPDGSAGCEITFHNATMGEVTPNTKDRLLKNGENDSEVECSVQGASAFDVQGTLFQAGNFLSIGVKGLKAKGNGGPTKDAPAPGGVSFSSPTTAGENYSTEAEAPCNFFYTDKTNQDVAAGRAWLTFNCPSITNGSSKCELGDSYVILENCTGTAEEE